MQVFFEVSPLKSLKMGRVRFNKLEFRAWAAGNRVAVEARMACQCIQAVWTA